ncbi:hypothetical protein T492DRAFT_1009242 [Pavlovales sp. CCMP2436]|nr:hypothetical protein T492DRAFT_1009242 [Pavlovales sp. CCMP2436]
MLALVFVACAVARGASALGSAWAPLLRSGVRARGASALGSQAPLVRSGVRMASELDNAPELAPELSRPLPIARLSSRQRQEVVPIVASPDECAAVAARLDVPQIHSFVALCLLRKGAGETVAVRGNLTAEVSQRCVVSNELFRSTVKADFAVLLHPDEASLKASESEPGSGAQFAFGSSASADDVVDEEVLEQPDLVDLGEMATQYLSLNLDQFPRMPGASFEDYYESEEAEDRESGFKMGDLFPQVTPEDLLGGR